MPRLLPPPPAHLPKRDEACTQLAAAGASFYARGWMLATAGNLSARIDGADQAFVVTASGGNKGQLTPSDFLEGTLPDGVQAGSRKPSDETVVHRQLYAARPREAFAILHVHAPYLTLMSRLGAAQRRVSFAGWEYVKALGFWEADAEVWVPIVPNHHDLAQLAQAVAAAAGETPAVLVDGHGVYAWGESIASAQRHIEAVEVLSQLCFEMHRLRRG